MLCMPATSVASQRIFSNAGDILRAKEIRWRRYVTKYVRLYTLSLSDLDFSVAI